MTAGMTAKEYTAKFEMLAGRTGFDDVAFGGCICPRPSPLNPLEGLL